MPFYYSVTANGFDDLQSDSVEISAETFESLQTELATGKVLEPDSDGNPMATDVTVTEAEQIAAKKRKRDQRITAVMWRVQRYESEVRQGKTSTTDDITTLDTYLQTLRDMPSQDDFLTADWPDVPAEQTAESEA